MSNELHLDAIDRDILLQLRRDGRLTNVELARRVGLTPPPCLRRVQRLEEAGVITGYHATVDPAAVGRGLEVLISVDIRASDLQTVREFEATVAAWDEVSELLRMFGKPDYYLTVAVADHGAYEEFLTSRLMGLPAVERVQSHLTMKRIKSTD